MDKIMDTIFAMIEIIFFVASTIILFVAAAIIGLIVMIATMAYAPVTLFVESANIDFMKSWITKPFDLATKISSNRWKNLRKTLP
jgi:hypothetical protein